MKRLFFKRLCLIAVLFLFANSDSSLMAANGDEFVDMKNRSQIAQALDEMFEAFASGDVNALKNLFADDMYSNYQTLLDKNTSYPQYLRDYYQGALFEITEITPSGQEYTATISVIFPDGSRNTAHYLFANRRLDSQKHLDSSQLGVEPNGWFIVRQIFE